MLSQGRLFGQVAHWECRCWQLLMLLRGKGLLCRQDSGRAKRSAPPTSHSRQSSQGGRTSLGRAELRASDQQIEEAAQSSDALSELPVPCTPPLYSNTLSSPQRRFATCLPVESWYLSSGLRFVTSGVAALDLDATSSTPRAAAPFRFGISIQTSNANAPLEHGTGGTRLA